MIITAGPFLLVELNQHARLHRLSRQRLLLRLAAVAPVHLIRLAQMDHLLDP